jgi:tetratricopeptide (TPR) repeat protein
MRTLRLPAIEPSASSRRLRYERAIADYDMSIKLDPTYATACYNRGNSRLATGDKDGAAADYQQLVADLPWRQRFRKALPIELRVGARPRYRPYVDHEVDAGLPQQIDELGDRPGRVAYGEKNVRVIAPTGEGA